jgi:predicted outer membrane repeat protein
MFARQATNLFRLFLVLSTLAFLTACGGGGGGSGSGGETIYVDSSATGGNDGTTWANAYSSLGDALDAAASGDEIWVAQGTYRPTTGTDRTASFSIKAGVSLYGGFSGDETSRDERDWGTNTTILSGDIGVASNTSDNSYHVVVVSNGSTIDGFTIRDGNANGDSTNSQGGGIVVSSCSTMIAHCAFTGNLASNGGGMYIYAYSLQNVTITDCVFQSNASPGSGGAMSIYTAAINMRISGCTFTGNSSDGDGGGIYMGWKTNPVITECTFSGNSCDVGGGGICIYQDSTPLISHCSFTGNSAANGGGACCDLSQPSSETAKLTSCTFAGNTAYRGGGLYLRRLTETGPVLQLANCVFSLNSATFGGGAYVYSGDMDIINCTFKGNAGGTSGGAVQIESGSPTLANCIMWDDTAPSKPEIEPGTGNPTIKYCCIEGGYTGAGITEHIIASDPLFAAGSFVLQFTSPCKDSGNNASVPSGITTDIAGNTRIANTTVDMGAYEYH